MNGGGKDQARSWFVLMAASLLHLIETGTWKGLGVLLPDIREQLNTKTWVVGLAISLSPGFGAVISIVAGVATNVLKIQPRITIAVCAAMFSIGLLIASFTTDVYWFFIACILLGFATGSTSVAAGSLSSYFDNFYDIAVSLLAFGMGLGIMIMPILTQFFHDIYGVHGALLLLCAVSCHATVCAMLFTPLSTTGVGTYLLLSDDTDKQSWFSVIDKYLDITYLFSNYSYIAIFVLNAGNGFLTTSWLIYVVPHAIDVGYDPYMASVVATVGGIGNLTGTGLYPILNRCISSKIQLYTSVCVISASFILDVFAMSLPSFIGMNLCAAIFGFARGILTPAVYATANKTIPEDKMLNAMGWFYGGFGLASLCGGFVCGWLYDQYGSYRNSFLLLSAMALVAAIPQCIDDTRRKQTDYEILRTK